VLLHRTVQGGMGAGKAGGAGAGRAGGTPLSKKSTQFSLGLVRWVGRGEGTYPRIWVI
jgi:hypothetical protein